MCKVAHAPEEAYAFGDSELPCLLFKSVTKRTFAGNRKRCLRNPLDHLCNDFERERKAFLPVETANRHKRGAGRRYVRLLRAALGSCLRNHVGNDDELSLAHVEHVAKPGFDELGLTNDEIEPPESDAPEQTKERT